MISKEQIQGLVEEKISGTGLFIVDIAVKPGNKIKVTIDSKEGVPIDKCVEVSRFIERSLDRDEEDFELQVSSPGLGKPFKVMPQYEKNIGKKVEVETSEGEKVKGVLKEVSKDELVIEVEKKVKKEGKKKKELVYEEQNIAFNKIKETKLVIDF